MITVNTNLKNAITGKGSQLIKITGTCYDTSNVSHTFTWTNADIVQGSFYVDKRCVSGSQFSFGNTVSNELGFELFGPYTDWLLEGVMVTVSLGGYVSGVATYFEVGKFILEKPAQDMDRLTCHGYDLLTKLDVNADNWVMNVNSGENILGQAVKPSPSYLMNADGYQNLIAGSVTTPYYNSNPLSAATGMVPFVQNGHAPQKIVIKAAGNTVVPNDSYFILFWYNAGNLEVVSGLTWAFDWSGYYSSTTVSTGEYHIDFVVDPGHTKTKVQEYLETQYGVTDCYIAFTLTTSSMGNFTSVEISYGGAATAKIGDTVDAICTACGLEFIAGYPAPDNLVETYTNLADYSQYSYRTILGLFAQACGANLTLWPSGYGVYDGQVRFAIPTASGVTLDETKVLSCEIADEPVLINGARFVSSSGALFINTTDNTEPYKYFDFTGCPVFPKDAQTAVDNLAGFTGASNTWLPGKAKILAMPWLEPMDIVNFAYTVKPNYTGKFLITRVRIGANGATYIESAGYYQSTTNSNGYVPTDYTPVAPFGLTYSTYSESVTPGTTTNVAMSTFTHNMPTVNDYVKADSGFGIVTDVNGSFATVKWLDDESGGGGSSGDTYTFEGGQQSFTVTPSSTGTAQVVPIKPQIFKGTCATAAGTAAKVVTCPEFTSADLVAGAVCFVTFNNTNSYSTLGSLTLNVNGTGAKNIKYMRNAAESNLPGAGYLRANMTYRFVYTGTYWVCDTDYDSDRYLIYRSFRVASGAGSLYSYHLVAFDDNGDMIPFNNITTNAVTTYTKAMNTKPFDPFRGFLYYTGSTTTAAGSVRDANEFATGYTLDCRYSFNIYASGTAGSTALTAYDPVYVRALYDTSTHLATFTADVSSASYLERSSIVQALPSSDPNTGLATGTFYVYILVGQAYTKYNICLFDNNTVFYWNGSKTVEFTGVVESNFERVSNRVTAIGPGSTDTKYPTAKAVYDALDSITILTSDTHYGFTVDSTPAAGTVMSGTVAQAIGDDLRDLLNGGKSVVIYDDAMLFDHEGNDYSKVYYATLDGGSFVIFRYFCEADGDTSDEELRISTTDTFAIYEVSYGGGGSTAGIFKGTCGTGAGGDPKVVTCPEFTSSDLVKGAVIFVTFTYTNSVSVNTVQMNVNGTGAKRIMQRKNTVVGTMTTNGEILANQTYMFVYDGTYWVLINDDDRTNVTALGDGFKNIGTTYRYQFLVSAPKDDPNATDHKRALFAINAVNSGSTTYTKAFRTWSFDPFGIFAYWNSTDTVSSEGTFGDPTRLQIECKISANYSFNVKQNGTVGTQGFVDNTAVYMKSKYDFATQTATLWQDTASTNYLDRSGLVQELPTTNPNTSTDTYIYIYLGQAYGGDARTFYLVPYHPVYMWNEAKGCMDLFTGGPLEGDGTCTLTDGNSFSFTAYYHKIGKQVTIYGTIPSGGSATSLSGLPYAASGDFRGTIMFLANTLTNMMIGRFSTTASSTDLGVAGYASIGSVSGQSDTATWLSAIPSTGAPFTFTYLTATP